MDRNPVVVDTGARFSANMVSAITPREKLHFPIIDGDLDEKKSIECHKRAQPWNTATLPTASPDPCWKPEDSGADHTLNREEPENTEPERWLKQSPYLFTLKQGENPTKNRYRLVRFLRPFMHTLLKNNPFHRGIDELHKP